MGNKKWLFIFAGFSGIGGLASCLSWLGIKPQNLWGWRMSLAIPHWLWLVGALLLFVFSIGLSGYGLYQNRTQQQESSSTPGPDMKASVEEPPLLESKLKIYSANYRAWKGAGETFDVTDFLRKIIVGNGLVHGPIENDSFVIDGKNYVQRDPLSGQPKRLQVKYSYDDEEPKTIERAEHSRLLLPEDSTIEWLKQEVEKAKTRDYPRKVFTLEKSYPDGPSTIPTVTLKNKIRMILTNHLDRDVCVWTPLWESTEVQAEGSPPGSTIQLAKREWQFEEWGDEQICATVPIGRSFSTYVAVRPAIGRSISERMRTGDWIGTALLPTKIDGKLYVIPIEIGKKL
jgi:hypothetical protein